MATSNSHRAPGEWDCPTAVVEVVFLRAEEGARDLPPNVSQPGKYRPHFVVQDRHERAAEFSRGNDLGDKYLGVTTVAGPQEVVFGAPRRCTVALVYFPKVSYSKLIVGATFTIREGARVVGHGVVLERADAHAGGAGERI